MAWQGIEGHDRIVERFRRALARGRLASSFLFVGPPGIGKRTLALKLAQTLLCDTHPAEMMEPCGTCSACRQVQAGTHPDLILIARPEDKSFIPLELLIGSREHRMREGLCHDIALKPYCGGRKVAIIDDADDLNEEGANCLLKTLEEPPPDSVIFLIGTSQQQQLPTIRSRCAIVRFDPLPEEVVARLVAAQREDLDQQQARELAAMGQGSIQWTLQLADDQLQQFRPQLLEWLATVPPDPIGFVGPLSDFIDAAGKQAPPRRARMRQVAQQAIEFYRQLMRRLGGNPLPDIEPALDEATQRAAARWLGDEQTAARCLDRCLDVLWQIDANANQATLLQCWLDDLSRLIAAPGATVAPTGRGS